MLNGAVTFYNHTDGKWAGANGHEIEVTVYEGLSPNGTSHRIKLGDSWSYPRKTDIKYKIKSCTVTKGWATYEGKVYGHASHSLYIVESNHALSFNVAHEWPPKFRDKL